MTIAYTLLLRQLSTEILLVGRDKTKAEGEAMDMTHAQAFLPAPMDIIAGDLEDVAGSDVVVIAASVPVPDDIKDRNDLARQNADLMREILPKIAKAAPDAIILLVTNPVDALTWQAIELTGFPANRVIGTGTLIDSIRFRELLSEMLEIHPQDLRAYILGERGENQFPAMSVAQSGGERIDDTPERRALSEKAKGLGIEVFHKKGNTCYAIGLATAYVIESILKDEKRTMPLSVKLDGYLGIDDVCLSLPVVVGKKGVERIIHPELSEEESKAFQEAANVVREVITKIS